MSAEHTPGPWHLYGAKKTLPPHYWIVMGGGGLHIAEFPKLIEEARDEQAANARLIAAAPELLHTLLMVREAAIDMRGENFNLTTEQWAAFHAALAKATGGEA